MGVEKDIEYGVTVFKSDIDEAIAEREKEILEFYMGDSDLALLALGRVEDFLNAFYPLSPDSFQEICDQIEELGWDETCSLAEQLASKIIQYRNMRYAGVEALTSPSAPTDYEVRFASSAPLRDFIFPKVWTDVEEFGLSNKGAEYTQVFCYVISRAGFLFFDNGHNKSGEGIKSAFLLGVGLIRLWFRDDIFIMLSNMSSEND